MENGIQLAEEKYVEEKKNLLNITVGEYQNQLTEFLKLLKLPNDNILVDYRERKKVINNIPDIIDNIVEEKRASSYYISKLVAASGAGLFDAALNYLWDETISSLKRKISLFDFEYFQSTLPESTKKKVTTIDDLRLIDDNDIVIGCSKIGILSDIGFKHIDYIRTMRNWVSAAHPNQAELTGLNICDWLETCIREVIGKEPSRPAIQTQQLLNNLRINVYSINDVESIKQALDTTPTEFIISLFTTIFGMFCEPEGKVEVKNNIRLIAKTIWKLLPEQQKKETGIKYATWSVNGDLPRKKLAREFLETVDGLSYLTEDELVVEMTESLHLLKNNHFNWNNFYNEPPFAKLIKKYIPDNGKVPDAIRREYVKTLFLCRIGNGYGVSSGAEPIYDQLIGKFTDNEIIVFLTLFSDIEVQSQLQCSDCQKNLRAIISVLKTHTSNSSILRVFDFIDSKHDKQLALLSTLDDFQRLMSSVNLI